MSEPNRDDLLDLVDEVGIETGGAARFWGPPRISSRSKVLAVGRRLPRVSGTVYAVPCGTRVGLPRCHGLGLQRA
jgi:hypothetical protein